MRQCKQYMNINQVADSPDPVPEISCSEYSTKDFWSYVIFD